MTTRSVLLVEDDFALRDMMTTVLRVKGYSVTGAANGREALDCLRAGVQPGLILLDLMMPVMDGWQFRREQQQQPRLASIPVLVISADVDIANKANQLKVVGYLQKPVDFDELILAIERYVSAESGLFAASMAELS